MKGLSTPDPKAEIQRDKHGEIIYDTDLKDTEIVPYKESIEDYMDREVLPHLPGAKAFFLEDLKAKKPVIKTGAKFKFTSFFYQYENLGVPHELIKGFYGFGEGVRQGLTFDDVKRIKFPVPPLDEQRKIAELLDQKWALVDSLRDQLKCQIARLEALKRSMVYADAIGECPEQMFRKVPR